MGSSYFVIQIGIGNPLTLYPSDPSKLNYCRCVPDFPLYEGDNDMKPFMVPILVLVVTFLPQNTANRKTITLDQNYCSSSQSGRPEKLEPGNNIVIVWNDPSVEHCGAYFKGVGEDLQDLYKVCVKTISYRVKDCDVKLTYSEGAIIAKSYSCYSTPSTWCTEPGSKLIIRLKKPSSLFDDLLPDVFKPATASLTLEVYTEAVYTVGTYAKLGTIIGAAGGGLIGLVIIIIFVVCIVQHMRSKRKQRDETDNNQDLAMSQRTDQPRVSDSLISPSSVPGSVNVNIDGDVYKSDPADLPPPSYDKVMAFEADESRVTT
ncbi:uncharacterized protein LOC110446208 [Mizuhopecten yessoensis]|uniref:Uncharacterized protein n=1 Tax=Mizuhopecten yessoensis TaxID=6573 RepID=A0A210R679_MIZYE|nr:uncharacterized protein LOC110446208 [Mizuhopecten yessoensis]OWF56557.1 hypothetical protein KP79_PYT12033 [Mizuhopecten yessoensis]